MLVRIRHITHKRRGTIVQSERIVDKQTLNIGRATDQDIFISDLGVSYHHARLTLGSDGTIGVSSLSKVGVYVNGRYVQSSSIRKSGELVVGPYKIKINSGVKLSHVKGTIEVDITYERIAEDVVQAHSKNLPATRLSETWLNNRVASWTSVILILLIFLVIPISGLLNSNVQESLRESLFLPSDGAWNTGDVAAPHRHFKDKCETCHTKSFHKSENSACTECHYDLQNHSNIKNIASVFPEKSQCTYCHREHNGASGLIRNDKAICTDCHKNLGTHVTTTLDNVEDFEQDHKEFRPYLYQGDTINNIEHKAAERISLNEPDISHTTGLHFSHAMHLNVNGLKSPDGKRILVCDDCHQKDASQKIILPVKMELHCSECHQLPLNDNVPEIRFKHVDVETMAQSIKEHYALTAISTGKGLWWTKQQTKQTLLLASGRKVCGQCHEINFQADTVTGWDIRNVKIGQQVYDRSEFSHYAHRTTSCQNCHKAEKSTLSKDVLYPGIAACKECHGGEDAEDKISSSCTMCHNYHDAGIHR